MLAVLQFVFADFWHFAGTLLLVGAIAEGVGGMLHRRDR